MFSGACRNTSHPPALVSAVMNITMNQSALLSLFDQSRRDSCSTPAPTCYQDIKRHLLPLHGIIFFSSALHKPLSQLTIFQFHAKTRCSPSSLTWALLTCSFFETLRGCQSTQPSMLLSCLVEMIRPVEEMKTRWSAGNAPGHCLSRSGDERPCWGYCRAYVLI
jgi:hypothetical protein